MLAEIIRMIESNFFSPVEYGIFEPLLSSLLNSDPFLVCADFDDYCRAQEEVSAEYGRQEGWTTKAILNVARSGPFSSDRTIEEYARDIWGVSCEHPTGRVR